MAGALIAVVSRNRRRYGGYIVHIGIAVLLIGIAASSSFQTNRQRETAAGRKHRRRRAQGTYVKPTERSPRRRSRSAPSSRCEKGGTTFAVDPNRRYFRPTGVATSTLDSYFEGEADSRIGLKAGLASDFWARCEPDISGVQGACAPPTKASGPVSPASPGRRRSAKRWPG